MNQQQEQQESLQQSLPETKVETTALPMIPIADAVRGASSSSSSLPPLSLSSTEEKILSSFVGYGLLRSSSDEEATSRRKNAKLDIDMDVDIENKPQPSRIPGQPKTPPLCSFGPFTIPDHEFKWHDLDANDGINQRIDGKINSYENCLVHPSVVVNTQQQVEQEQQHGLPFDYDILFWINKNSSRHRSTGSGDNHRFGESSNERNFQERMEALENEIYNNCRDLDLPMMESSSAMTSSSSSSSSWLES